jgi:hypothetical protein
MTKRDVGTLVRGSLADLKTSPPEAGERYVTARGIRRDPAEITYVQLRSAAGVNIRVALSLIRLYLYSRTAETGSPMNHKKDYTPPHLISYAADKVPEGVIKLFQGDLPVSDKPWVAPASVDKDESNASVAGNRSRWTD